MEGNLFVSKYVADQKKGLASLDTFLSVAEMDVEQTQKSRKRQFTCIQQSTRSFRPFKRTAAQLYSNSKTKAVIVDENKGDLSALKTTAAWHSKRMVTETIAGHSVALHSMQRGLKATKRLYKEKCLIQDVSLSLVVCIHVPLDDCFRLFATITDAGDTLFQMNLMKIPDLEIALFLHEPSQFPLGLIGPCTISMHRYQAETNTYMMQLVIWAHPSIHSLVLSTVQSSSETECIPIDMQNSEAWPWSRIEFMGHEANKLLGRMMEGSEEKVFLEQCLTDKIKQHNTWRNGYMLSARLSDPRCLSHDTKQSRPSSNSSDTNPKKALWPSNNIHATTLWSRSNLQQINSTFATDLTINRQRQQVSDAQWDDVILSLKGNKQASIVDSNRQKLINTFPIIITRHHKSSNPITDIHRTSLGGWSIIIPRAYIHSVWQHLIYLGGIACGGAEVDFIQRGEGLLSFPRDFLDSEIGWQSYVGRLRCVQEKEMKKPPAKRLQWDYDLPLAFFQPPDTENNSETFAKPNIAVIRNPTYLQPFPPPKLAQSGGEKWLQSIASHSDWQRTDFDLPSDEASEAMAELPPMPVRTFLHVLVEPVGRGQPHSFAAIYRPTSQDVKLFVQHKIKHKMKIKGVAAEAKDGEVSSCEWHGLELNSVSGKQEALAARELLGIITSGDEEKGSSDLRAVGMCGAERLYEMMRCHFMRLGHPCSHQVVLFRNQGSDWLRPGLIRII